MLKIRIIHVLSFGALVGSIFICLVLLIFTAILNPLAAFVIAGFNVLGQFGMNYIHCKKCKRRNENAK